MLFSDIVILGLQHWIRGGNAYGPCSTVLAMILLADSVKWNPSQYTYFDGSLQAEDPSHPQSRDGS